MRVTINSKEIELPAGTSLAEILKTQSLDGPGYAVAVDGKVVRQQQREETILTDGATILVIKAVCGG